METYQYLSTSNADHGFGLGGAVLRLGRDFRAGRGFQPAGSLTAFFGVDVF
jgi:hypothetical protein